MSLSRSSTNQATPFQNNNRASTINNTRASTINNTRASTINNTRASTINNSSSSGTFLKKTTLFGGKRKNDSILKELENKIQSAGGASVNTSMLYNKNPSTNRNAYVDKRKERQPRIISQKEELIKKLSHLSLTFSSQLSDKDEVLKKQFIHFHKEFLDVATSLGATVPLDLHENNMSGLLFNFLKHRGPKYVLQIMSQKYDVESQGAHLQTLSLSLLITVVTILAKKMVDTANLNGWTQGMSENVSIWSRLSLNKIVYAGAINILVNMLMTTHVQKIQELILGLLAQLAEVSNEACHVMLMPFSNDMNVKVDKTKSTNSGKTSSGKAVRLRSPSTIGSPTNRASSPTMDDERSIGSISSAKSRETFDGDLKKEIDLDISPYKGVPGTNLSYLLTIAIMNRNKYAIVSGIIDIIISLCITNTVEICEAVAMTPTCNISNINTNTNSDEKPKNSSSKYNTAKSSTDKVDHSKGTSKSKNIIEWAGLKLLIKTGIHTIHYIITTLILILILIQVMKWIIYSSQKGSQFRQNQSMALTQRKAIFAISCLIVHSPNIAMYTLSLKGAVDVIVQSIKMQPGFETELEIVGKCLKILQPIEKIFDQSRGTQKLSTRRFNSVASSRERITSRERVTSRERTTTLGSFDGDFKREVMSMYEKVRQEDAEYDVNERDGFHIQDMYTNSFQLPDVSVKRVGSPPKPKTPLQDISMGSRSRKVSEESPSEIYRNHGLSRPSTSPSFETLGSYFQKQGPRTRPNSRAGTPYHCPESPLRRGLSPHTANNDPSLSTKVFFESLPNRPFVPDRLEPAEIIKGNCYELGYDPDESRLIFEAIANKEVKMLEREGYIKNGQSTIGILERAERVYLPVKSQGEFYSSATSLNKLSKGVLNSNVDEYGSIAQDNSPGVVRDDNERKVLGGDLDDDDDLSFQPSTFSFEDVTGNISTDLLQNFGSIHDFSNLDKEDNEVTLTRKPKVSYSIELLLP